MGKFAVVLFNLGGPDSLDVVEPFLFNLFSDPDIFKFPFLKKWFASRISRKRTPKVKLQYEKIGGSSPINSWTEIQRHKLEKSLRAEITEIDVFVGMRYWHPLIETVVSQIEKNNYSKVILLPLYPQYSISTTGSAFNEWNRHYNGDESIVHLVDNYFDNKKYIGSINDRIDEALEKFDTVDRDNATIVFSAHGVPVSYIKKGDPYNAQILSTIDSVMSARDHSHDHYICYQSKVGPIKWLEPSTESMIRQLGEHDKQNLLIVPISFVSDHIETLYEIGVEYKSIAEQTGVKNFIVTEGLNDSEIFVSALKEIVITALGKK